MGSAGGVVGLDSDAFAHAQHRVMQVREALAERRLTTRRRADDLLHGGWGGAAAEQYAAAWRDWDAGVTTMLESLRELSVAMTLARAGLGLADAVSEVDVSRVADRLGPVS